MEFILREVIVKRATPQSISLINLKYLGAVNDSSGNLKLHIKTGSSLSGDIINNSTGSVSGTVSDGSIVNSNIINNGSGNIDFTISNGGVLYSNAIRNGFGVLDLTINEGGLWSGTGVGGVGLIINKNGMYKASDSSSYFSSIIMGNNGTIDFGEPLNILNDSFKTIFSKTMKQTNGTGNIVISTNLGLGKGDLLSVDNVMSGNYKLDVTNYGNQPTSANESLRIIQAGTGSNIAATLTGNQYRDAGLYRYYLVKDDAGTGYWLVNGDGSGKANGGGDDDISKSGNAYDSNGNPIDSNASLPTFNNGITTSGDNFSDLAHTLQGASVAKTIALLSMANNSVSHTDSVRNDIMKGGHNNNIWINNFYSDSKISSDIMGRNYKVNTNSTYLGFDKYWDVDADTTIASGIFAGQGWADSKYNLNGSKGNINITSIGIYSMYGHSSGLFADATLQGYKVKSNHDAYDEQGQHSSYDFNSSAASISLNLGKRFYIDNTIHIEPSLKLSYLKNNGKKVSVHGANNLIANIDDVDILQYGAGLNFGKTFVTDKENSFVNTYLGLTIMGRNVSGGDIKSSGSSLNNDLDGYQLQANMVADWKVNKNNNLFGKVSAGSGDKFKNSFTFGVGYQYSF